MLTGIDPLLTGDLLALLDGMGHSDTVAVVDAHFPAARVGAAVIERPGIGAARMLRAVRSVLPPDDERAVVLMTSATGILLPVQDELVCAAAVSADAVDSVERYAFYDEAATSSVVIRTGETRAYGNALFRKGLVEPEEVDR
jgi:L-fucose mutarotase